MPLWFINTHCANELSDHGWHGLHGCIPILYPCNQCNPWFNLDKDESVRRRGNRVQLPD